tara:strand:+ start:270 stop:710 length:441 start_codon:yes stop_codon:yes gene_type:complete
MRFLIVFSCFLLTTGGFAQKEKADTVVVNHQVPPPQIVVKAHYGKMINLGDVEIKFKEVVTDSRCPGDANCIWAGEAIIKVELYKNGKFLEEKEIKFSGTTSSKMVFKTPNRNILAYSLSPYPKVANGNIKKNEYCLNIVLRNQTD